MIKLVTKEKAIEYIKNHRGFISQIQTDPDENGKCKYMKVELVNGYTESIGPGLHL